MTTPIATTATNPIASAVAGILLGAFEIWARHQGKPEGWVPTQDEWGQFLDEVGLATPEARKALAAKRLGIPWPPAGEAPPVPISGPSATA